MKILHLGLTLLLASIILVARTEATECPPDAVEVGPLCVDKYEASVWETTDVGAIQRIKSGTIRTANELARAASQRGLAGTDYPCLITGDTCRNKIFAVSIPGVIPSQFVTWFQAQQACANSGKRLLTNAEWQMAAAGTPDGPACVVNNTGPGVTGTRSCVSTWGAFDMVGNVWEWVADWVPLNLSCPGWDGFSDDSMCLAGADALRGPGTMVRGGRFDSGSLAGVFSLIGTFPTVSGDGHGFRCARPK